MHARPLAVLMALVVAGCDGGAHLVTPPEDLAPPLMHPVGTGTAGGVTGTPTVVPPSIANPQARS